MEVLGPDRASVEVLVFREGLLSRAGHDLVLRAAAFEISVDPGAAAVSARVDAGSLRVAAAMRDGRPLAGALSPSDVREIEAAIRDSVLRSARFPEIRFVSTSVAPRAGGLEVRGSLSLAGAIRDVALVARRERDRLVAEGTLHQPSFGIAPYRAMLGALRVKPHVIVRASVPAAAVGAGAPGPPLRSGTSA